MRFREAMRIQSENKTIKEAVLLTICRYVVILILMLIGSACIFWSFQLNFQSFHSNLKTIHSLNSCLSTCRIVKRHKTYLASSNSNSIIGPKVTVITVTVAAIVNTSQKNSVDYTAKMKCIIIEPLTKTNRSNNNKVERWTTFSSAASTSGWLP